MSLAEKGDSQELGPGDRQPASSPSSPSPEHQYRNDGYQRDAASPTSTEQGHTDSQDVSGEHFKIEADCVECKMESTHLDVSSPSHAGALV